MADFPPPYAPPGSGDISNSYTPSQYEAVKGRFKDLFRIIPKLLRPFFLLLHDKLGNSYPSTDIMGRILTRGLPREEHLKVFRRKCTNDASNAGSHSIKLEPAIDSILLLYLLSSVNKDAAAVNNNSDIRTAGAVLIAYLWSVANLAAGLCASFPRSVSGTQHLDKITNPSLFLTDELEVRILTGSVAVSEDTDFFILYSYIGDAPTVTETGPTGSVFSDIS